MHLHDFIHYVYLISGSIQMCVVFSQRERGREGERKRVRERERRKKYSILIFLYVTFF